MVTGQEIRGLIRKLLLLAIIILSISYGQKTDSLEVKTPQKAALWGLLPGGGQIYNEKYLKAGIIITLESLAIGLAIDNGAQYRDSADNANLLNRNKYAWWAFFIHIYGLLDAIVDQHLKSFDDVMQDELIEPETIKPEKEL